MNKLEKILGLFAFRSLSIVPRFIIYLVLIGIVPLLVVGLSSYLISTSFLQKQANQSLEVVLKQQRDNLDLRLEQVENLISNLSGEEAITEVLNINKQHDDTYNDLATKARIGYTLNSFLNLKWLISIDLLSTNGPA